MRPLVALALVGGLLGPALAAAQSATPDAEVRLRPGMFELGGGPVEAQFGEFRVRANRTAPGGAQLTLRFVRFPSTATAPAPPIVFLAGGPGDAATRALAGMPPAILAELRAIADVIAFDQRGTGTSEPQEPLCPPSPLLPRDRPGDPSAIGAALAPHLERCLAEAAARGIDLQGLTTIESADDVEALRQALGVPSLQILAGSYGTHLALAVARRHPRSVAAMALAGVEGPDDTFKLPSQVDSVLVRIAAARRPALLDEVRTLRQRLAAEPGSYTFPTGQTIVLGEWDLQRWIAESLDAVPEIAAMVAAMPALLEGDYATLARWTLTQRMPVRINLMNLAMDCASYASPARRERIRAEAGAAVLGNAINHPKASFCELPGLPRLGDEYRAPMSSPVAALLVAGTFDGRTPVRNAVHVAAAMPNAELLVIDGASHGLLGHPQVMERAMALFRGAPAAAHEAP